jgi:hypothetical protein
MEVPRQIRQTRVEHATGRFSSEQPLELVPEGRILVRLDRRTGRVASGSQHGLEHIERDEFRSVALRLVAEVLVFPPLDVPHVFEVKSDGRCRHDAAVLADEVLEQSAMQAPGHSDVSDPSTWGFACVHRVNGGRPWKADPPAARNPLWNLDGQPTRRYNAKPQSTTAKSAEDSTPARFRTALVPGSDEHLESRAPES